jgi:ankyrin repeat protein
MEPFPLTKLPGELQKLIIASYPCISWFTLSKNLKSLASQVISPLDHRNKEAHCALCWAVKSGNIASAIWLIKSQLFDPAHNNNFALRRSSRDGYKPIVELLLKDRRCDPAAVNNWNHWSLLNACQYNHPEIVKLILNDRRVDPSYNNRDLLMYACRSRFREVVELLLRGMRSIGECSRDSMATLGYSITTL